MRLIALLLSLISSAYSSDILEFKLDGKLIQTFKTSAWKKSQIFSLKNEQIKLETLELYDIYYNKEKSYDGFDFEKILNSVYGEKWREAKLMNFSAKDGYRKGTQVKYIVQAFSKNKKGLITTHETGMKGFEIVKRKGKKDLDIGEIYLVWSAHKKGDKLSSSQTKLQWPWQLKTIDLKTK